MQLFVSKMKLHPLRFWLVIVVAMGGVSPLFGGTDFSETRYSGVVMERLFPFVLGLLTLLAPQGKRLLVFGLALFGLPLFASAMYAFVRPLPDETAGDLWFKSTALVAEAGLLVLMWMRFRRSTEVSWAFSWSPARLVAGVLLFLSAALTLTLVFQARTMGSLLAITNLAALIAFMVILVNLWRYRPWAWWSVLALTLAGILTFVRQFPTLLLHAGGWLSLTPALLILVLLLLPSTRRQCSRHEPGGAPSLH